MNDNTWLLVIGVVVVGVATLLLGGGSDPTGPVLAPVVDAGPDMVVSECTSVRVGCEGYDLKGGVVSYQWTAPRGSFDRSHVLNPVYTVPTTCGTGEDVVLTLTVTNEDGVSARDSLVVRVTNTIQCVSSAVCTGSIPCRVPVMPVSRPVISHPYALPQRTSYYSTCSVPPVSARQAVCVPPCPVPCSTCPPPVPTCQVVCAPPCPVPPVMCLPPAPVCPTPCMTSMGCCCSVAEGGSIQLRGTVCDPDGNLARYYWTADMGSFDDPWAINPIYCAPLIENPCGENVCITLTAIDSCGARATSQIVLRITDTNHPPVVNVGP